MSSKKIIFIIMILLVLFSFFIRGAFISLQKESFKINTYEYNNENTLINNALDIIDKDSKNEFEFINNSVILLIDNVNKDAVIYSKGEINSLKYNEIPNNIIKTNSFYLEINNENTIIINIDPLLGDLEERIISESYKYLFLSQNKLNPFEIDYFTSKNEDVLLRYYRNMIIDELINENMDIKRVKYFFNEWENYNSDDYNNVAHYDYYEGSKEFYKIKVKRKNIKDFNLNNYIENKRNKYGFFEKEDEYRIIGMLLLDYADRNNINLIRDSQTENNMYKNLLYKTPLINCEANISYNEFEINYNKYLENLPRIINENFNEFSNTDDVKFTFNDLTAEKYDYTFKINNNYFIYFNYKARTNDNLIIEKDYVIAYITPNKIEYYSK